MVSQRRQRGVKARAKWHLGGGLACAARGQAAAHRNPNERASLEMTCSPALGRGESSKIEKKTQDGDREPVGDLERCALAWKLRVGQRATTSVC